MADRTGGASPNSNASIRGDPRAIVDPEAGTVRFLGCFIRRRVGKAEADVSYPIRDIQAVYLTGPKYRYLLVVLPEGRARVGGGLDEIRPMRDLLVASGASTDGGPETANPRISFLANLGGLAGLLLALAALPAGPGGDVLTAVAIAGGAVGGFALVFVVIAAVHRQFGLRLVEPLWRILQPLAWGGGGLAIGLLARGDDANFSSFGLPGIGLVAGIGVGLLWQRLQDRDGYGPGRPARSRSNK